MGGVLILAAAAVFLGLTVGGGALGGSASTSQTYTGPISKIDLHGGSGTVEVRAGGSTGRVDVTRHLTWGPFGAQPVPDESVQAGVLSLSAGCRGFLTWCSIDYTVSVPDGTAVAVDQGSGAVRLSGQFGAVAAKTGSGSVTVSGAGDSVRLETGSGGISGNGLQSLQVYAHTGSGGIDLDLARAADSVRAETGSGGVTVRVPQGSYAVTVRTGSGGQRIGVANDPSSAHRIDASTGSGSVSVDYR